MRLHLSRHTTTTVTRRVSERYVHSRQLPRHNPTPAEPYRCVDFFCTHCETRDMKPCSFRIRILTRNVCIAQVTQQAPDHQPISGPHPAGDCCCAVYSVFHKSWGAPATCLRPRLSCMCGWRSRGQGGALATWHALLQRLWISQGSPQRRHGTPTLRHLLNKGGETPPDETETDSKVQDSKVRKSIPQRNAGTRMVSENALHPSGLE